MLARLTAYSGAVCSILDQSYIFMKNDHEIIFKVSLQLMLIQVGLLSVTSESIWAKNWLTA